MTHVSTRELQGYYSPEVCRSRISLLARVSGVSYSKLVWFANTDGLARGSTLRFIDINKAMSALEAYLVSNQHSNHCQVKKSMPVKRELLKILKILRDK